MDQAKLQELVQTFFVCDRQQIAEIFDEFLAAMEAEDALWPGGLMSRNYETAQANPEIHTIPGNLKDARDAIFPFFWSSCCCCRRAIATVASKANSDLRSPH